MPERVGFVGLGIMGRPMARNLMRAGYELVLYNRTRSKAEELAREMEAEVAESPAEVARSSGVTFTLMARERSGWAHSSLLAVIEDLAEHEIA